MKLPWQSSVVFYRTEGDLCVAEREATFIFTREVAPVLSASSMREAGSQVAEFHAKLRSCPFMVIDDVAISCEGTCQGWEDYAALPNHMTVEDECVVVNFCAALSFYEKKDSTYHFKNAGSLFCTVMCMPRAFHSSAIPRLQAYRKRTINTQINSSRIFLGDVTTYTCYNAADFSPRQHIVV
jgi:hypothetical protein